MATDVMMRIGELSEHVGVSTHVLRVWEQRYSLLRPVRSPGGYRLYSRADLERVQRVIALRSQGVAISSAAKQVLAAERAHDPEAATPPTSPVAAAMLSAITAFDEDRIESLLDSRLTTDTFENVLTHDLVPFLRGLGEGWVRGELSIAHEHFGTALVRRRIAPYANCWSQGEGPRVVLACPSHEQHEMMLYCLGIVLGRRGWQVRFLGADTPLDAVGDAATSSDLVVLAASRSVVLIDNGPEIAALAERFVVALGGSGVTSELAKGLGAVALPNDVLAAADALHKLASSRVPA